MKIKTKISNKRVIISEPEIEDVYYIEENEETGKFFIWSENGYNSLGLLEHDDIGQAITKVKKFIRLYFIDRGEQNPKGW